jgi:tetrahydromethanopterin S-methyltransferase subunit G
VLSNAMLLSLDELKARVDKPVFIVSSTNLFKVPGVVKDCVQAEPAVTSRLDNIEKMVESLAKGFKDMKASRRGVLFRLMVYQHRLEDNRWVNNRLILVPGLDWVWEELQQQLGAEVLA